MGSFAILKQLMVYSKHMNTHSPYQASRILSLMGYFNKVGA